MTQAQGNNNEQMKELIELNDELENYFTNTIIPQLFVDANLILRKFTPPAMKQFNFSPEHIGKSMEQMVDNIRFSTLLDNIHEVINSGKILEKEIQTSDFMWFDMNIIPYVVKKENKTNGVIITFVDITDRIKMLRELEMLNASHETFIYSVSHDLKGPLGNIESLVKILISTSESMLNSTREDAQDQKAITAMLENSVMIMKNTVNELTEISKIKGNFPEHSERIEFMNIFKEVKLTLQDKINESKADIQLDIKENLIDFSKKNLRSIIYNLLSNALKYKSPQRIPEIHIKTEKQDDFVIISVKDNGMGISNEKRDLVFSQFTRIDNNVDGTGIGLYLIKIMVENAGGRIQLDSNMGDGSEFKVYLKIPSE